MASDTESFRLMSFDPGVEGGFATWVDGDLIKALEMPRSDVSLLRSLTSFEPHVVVVESVHSSPKQSPAAAFTFGQEFRRITSLSLCVVHESHVFTVQPQLWQTHCGLIRPDRAKPSYAQKKRMTLKLAKERYGSHEITKGTSDAVLIGDWAHANLDSKRRKVAVSLYQGKDRKHINAD